MKSRTLHVLPEKDGNRWMVKRSTGGTAQYFDTQKAATDAAKRLNKGKIGQVVVLTRDDRVRVIESRGLPKLHWGRGRGKIGRRAIERAVTAVVKKRLQAS